MCLNLSCSFRNYFIQVQFFRGRHARKSWRPFRIYQLISTTNAAVFEGSWLDWLCWLDPKWPPFFFQFSGSLRSECLHVVIIIIYLRKERNLKEGKSLAIKVSKSRKQILKFSFEPKNERKYFCSFFGSNEKFKICFRDLLTFRER